jgi:hypothetical protein
MFSSGYSRTGDLFRTVTTSTTKTRTRATTIPVILKRSKLSRTSLRTIKVERTGKPIGSTVSLAVSLQCGRKLRIGTAARRVSPGIANTAGAGFTRLWRRPAASAELNLKTKAIGRETPSVVRTAASVGARRTNWMKSRKPVKYARRPSRQTNIASRDFAPELAPVSVIAVERLPERLPVYDLTVNGLPEFFANGILVHNCMKYALGTIGGATQMPLDQELEERLKNLTDPTTRAIFARHFFNTAVKSGKIDWTGKPKKNAPTISMRGQWSRR